MKALIFAVAPSLLAETGRLLVAGATSALFGFGWFAGVGVYVVALNLIEKAKGMSATIEWRVTCLGLQPRYYYGRNGRYQADKAALIHRHLDPVISWRENHGRGTGPWIDIADRDPNHVEAAS